MSFATFLEETTNSGKGGNDGTIYIFYIIVIAVLAIMFYFMSFKPQKKEEARRKALLETIAVGDSVVTTAGFYGVVIDMIEEQNIVVVEFGNNKNCRIPMKKSAIVEVEKAN